MGTPAQSVWLVAVSFPQGSTGDRSWPTCGKSWDGTIPVLSPRFTYWDAACIALEGEAGAEPCCEAASAASLGDCEGLHSAVPQHYSCTAPQAFREGGQGSGPWQSSY